MQLIKKNKNKKNNRCSVHFEEVTRGVLGQGEEVVYVLC